MLAIFRIRLCDHVCVFILLLPNDFFFKRHSDVLDFVVLKKHDLRASYCVGFYSINGTQSTMYHTVLDFYSTNPFTATACKISGLKGEHIHPCRQYI